jgi:hypothetical protein
MVNLTLDDLKALREHARVAATETAFCDLVLEWAAAAERRAVEAEAVIRMVIREPANAEAHVGWATLYVETHK